MNARKAKERRAARAAQAAPPRRGPQLWAYWKTGLVVAGVVVVLAASFALPGAFDGKPATNPHAAMQMGADLGAGLPVGSAVPSFDEKDVETGDAITSRTVFEAKTLLFFSEGVMCQACFEQIKGLEQFGSELDRRGIQLISITPDSPGDLRKMISSYGIATRMIADDDRDMSAAFNTLGQGMHGDTPGHAFVLVDHGKVLWYRDYWLAPTRAMYVEPEKLLTDIPSRQKEAS